MCSEYIVGKKNIMSIGAKDKLDRKLVHLYQNVQTINVGCIQSVNSDEMWRNMGLVGQSNKAFLEIRNKIAC